VSRYSGIKSKNKIEQHSQKKYQWQCACLLMWYWPIMEGLFWQLVSHETVN